MKEDAGLVPGKNCFTALDLLQRAAKHKGLPLQDSGQFARSESFCTHDLNEKRLKLLKEKGFELKSRPDCHYETVTLVDNNPQVSRPGYAASNYWNFKRKEGSESFNLRISLSVNLRICQTERGIILSPNASGTFLSPSDFLPNFRMFKALTESDAKALAVAKELAASEGEIIVTWTELGLGGMRSLRDLFDEFAGTNEMISMLSCNSDILDPVPHVDRQSDDEKMWVCEPAQPRLFKTWRQQIKSYRDSLAA
jgi:hypothetical protein